MGLEKWVKKLNLKEIKKENLIVLLLVGLLLMVIVLPVDKNSDNSEESATNKETEDNIEEGLDTNLSDSDTQYEETLENRLKEALKKVTGVGEVEVLITLKSSGEVIVEKDTPTISSSTSETDSNGGTRETTERQTEETTIYEQGSDGSSTPYVVKQLEPEIEGILVIAQGGDDSVVKENITEAVLALFSVEAHKIKVMKMD